MKDYNMYNVLSCSLAVNMYLMGRWEGENERDRCLKLYFVHVLFLSHPVFFSINESYVSSIFTCMWSQQNANRLGVKLKLKIVDNMWIFVYTCIYVYVYVWWKLENCSQFNKLIH